MLLRTEIKLFHLFLLIASDSDDGTKTVAGEFPWIQYEDEITSPDELQSKPFATQDSDEAVTSTPPLQPVISKVLNFSVYTYIIKNATMYCCL